MLGKSRVQLPLYYLTASYLSFVVLLRGTVGDPGLISPLPAGGM